MGVRILDEWLATCGAGVPGVRVEGPLCSAELS